MYLWTVSVLLLPGRPNKSLLYDDCLYSIFRFRLSDPFVAQAHFRPKTKGEGERKGTGDEGRKVNREKIEGKNPQVQQEELFCFYCRRSVVISGLWNFRDFSW